MQMQQRLIQNVEAADPRLRWRESVHPRNHPDTIVIRGCLLTQRTDGFSARENGLPDEPDRERTRT